VHKLAFHGADTDTDTDTDISDAPIVYFCKRVQQHTCTRAHPNGHPRDDPRAAVSEDVRVGVGVRVVPVKFQLPVYNSQYLRNGTTDFDEVSYSDATGPSGHRQRIKFRQF